MRKNLRMALLFVCLVLVAALANAQDAGTLIRGTVTDDQGVTLPGVTVTAKNVNAITGANGNYLIRVPAGTKTIKFTYLGNVVFI